MTESNFPASDMILSKPRTLLLALMMLLLRPKCRLLPLPCPAPAVSTVVRNLRKRGVALQLPLLLLGLATCESAGLLYNCHYNCHYYYSAPEGTLCGRRTCSRSAAPRDSCGGRATTARARSRGICRRSCPPPRTGSSSFAPERLEHTYIHISLRKHTYIQ